MPLVAKKLQFESVRGSSVKPHAKKKQKKTLKIAKDVDLYDGYLFYRNATCLNNLMKIKLLLETT